MKIDMEWDVFREEVGKKNPTRDAVIEQAFNGFADGHSAFSEKSSAEKQEAFYTFRSAWILSEMFRHQSGKR